MPYSYYASPGSVQRAGRPAPDEGRGSFGPVLVVLSVISFLAVAACIAGRLCGRRSSSRGKSSAEQQTADAEKGFGVKHPAEVMRPVASSRATVHDADDAFEIKFAPVKPAGWDKGRNGGGGGGIGRVQGLPQPQLGLPRPYSAAAPAGLTYAPSSGGGAVRLAPHPPARGTGAPFSFTPAKHGR